MENLYNPIPASTVTFDENTFISKDMKISRGIITNAVKVKEPISTTKETRLERKKRIQARKEARGNECNSWSKLPASWFPNK